MPASFTITINDPDLLAELTRYGDTDEQQQTALVALRLGIGALRAARGEIDTNALQRVGEHVLNAVQSSVKQVVVEQKDEILLQFSLDQPQSALSRLRQVNTENHGLVMAKLEAVLTRKQDDKRTTQGGNTFEEIVGITLAEIAHHANDHFAAVSNEIGSIANGKVGDFVVTLGTDCAAAGERIVLEAKRDMAYTRQKALDECKIARENRRAQIALFIWNKSYGELKKQPPLTRYGDDIIVLWDADDPSTDIYLKAAYWLARSLVVCKPQDDRVSQAQQKVIDNSFEQLTAQIKLLEKIKKSGDEVVKKGQEVVTTAGNMQSILEAHVEALQDQVVLLHARLRAQENTPEKEHDLRA